MKKELAFLPALLSLLTSMHYMSRSEGPGYPMNGLNCWKMKKYKKKIILFQKTIA
ncbi:hypothetical protein J7E95_14880 [Streptomyces sp. ISL-14]|nr:hypothetical protein [Streptomyces sp. ISL-14]